MKTHSIPRRLARWPITVFVSAAVFAGGGLAGAPAHAAEYPSWSDVEAARSSATSKNAEIQRINELLTELDSRVQSAQATANARSLEYEKAQLALDAATYRATTLQAQAHDARERATESQADVGRLVAQLARSGSVDPTIQLIFHRDEADQLLRKLGSLSKVTESMNNRLVAAKREGNTAQSLTDRAKAAQTVLAGLSKTAKYALAEALTAANTAETQLAAQHQTQGRLRAQLAVLVENRKATEADYRKGEQVRRDQEAAAARAAAAADGAASHDGGQLGGRGWAKPVYGWISDRFGPRPNRPVATSGAFHSGTDLAASCGTPIYAATGGRIVYAGWLGNYGNYVLIDHGSGVQTGYAHIQEGGILVANGQNVRAGQNIARVGTTGGSSGCHLHFEVLINGSRIDPQPFMSTRGITLG